MELVWIEICDEDKEGLEQKLQDQRWQHINTLRAHPTLEVILHLTRLSFLSASSVRKRCL
jgi:hypothetical protein